MGHLYITEPIVYKYEVKKETKVNALLDDMGADKVCAYYTKIIKNANIIDGYIQSAIIFNANIDKIERQVPKMITFIKEHTNIIPTYAKWLKQLVSNKESLKKLINDTRSIAITNIGYINN